jgi:5-(carboxyamino)imidazole ribonucleotide synthase
MMLLTLVNLTYNLCSDPRRTCKIACDIFFKGDLMDFETVYNFGKKVDVTLKLNW